MAPLARANAWLDISEVMAEKVRRVRAYATQDRRYRLGDLVTHLNGYRGAGTLRPHIRFAEAFFRLSREDFLECHHAS